VTLTESTMRVWSAPTRPRRRYRTKHAAYIGWAKDLIRAHPCGCEPGNWNEGPGPYTCPWHKRLFSEPAFACRSCGSPEPTPLSYCGNCGRGPCDVPTEIAGSARYMKLRNRLARWLRWASTRTA